MLTSEQLAEIHAIKELRIRYSHYFDGQELDKLVALFAEDAVCELSPEYGGNWEGREVIRNNFKAYMEDEGRPWSVLHSITNHLIELDGANAARGSCYLIDCKFTEEVDNPIFLLGVYHDEYRKVGDCWRFAKMRLDFLWPNRYIMAGT